jgi:hypothetical protein
MTVTPGQMTLPPDDQVAEANSRSPIAAPDIKRLPLLDVYDLRHHPRNIRKHNLDAIVESLRTYGQQSPIVVQKSTGFVCKGNGTLKAARDVLGWTHIYGSIEDFDDDTAVRYLLADNRASDLSQNDAAALGKLLRDLDGDAQGLQGSLFTIDDAEDIWADIGSVTTVLAETDAAYVETPEQLAARIEAKRSDRAGTLKEVVLVLDGEQYQAFAVAVSRLSRAYGTKGVVATVVEAVRRANEQVVA